MRAGCKRVQGETHVRIFAVCLIGSLVGARAAPLSPFGSPDPSDAPIRVPAVNYRSVTGSYVKQRPVEPGPWREQNERVTPPPTSGQ